MTHPDPGSLILLFPGQGSQHPGMGAGLIAENKDVSEAFHAALEAMGGLGEQVYSDWVAGQESLTPIAHVSRAQPLLFATGCAIGQAVLSAGYQPEAVLGHSGGELVAAVIAGLVDLGDAARILRARVGAATRHAPKGAMIAIAADPADIGRLLGPECDIAAVNAPAQTMVAGPLRAVEALRCRLADNGYTYVDVPATEPFHSRAMSLVALNAQVESITAHPPHFPVYSGFTGRPITTGEASSSDFWAQQVVRPVLFGAAVDNVIRAQLAGPVVLAEAGVGQVLTRFTQRCPALWERACSVVPLMPAVGTPANESQHFQSALTALALGDLARGAAEATVESATR